MCSSDVILLSWSLKLISSISYLVVCNFLNGDFDTSPEYDCPGLMLTDVPTLKKGMWVWIIMITQILLSRILYIQEELLVLFFVVYGHAATAYWLLNLSMFLIILAYWPFQGVPSSYCVGMLGFGMDLLCWHAFSNVVSLYQMACTITH